MNILTFLFMLFLIIFLGFGVLLILSIWTIGAWFIIELVVQLIKVVIRNVKVKLKRHFKLKQRKNHVSYTTTFYFRRVF